MRGQLIKRNEGTWGVKIYLGRNEKTGKRRFFNATIKGTKREADAFLVAKLRELDQGTFVEPVKLTLEEFIDQWLPVVAQRVRPRTYDDYEQKINYYVRHPLGGKKLADIRPVDLQTLYGDMQARGLSGRSVRYINCLLNSMFKTAVKWGMLARNPCEAVELPRLERREMKSLSPEEAARFVTAAVDDPHGLVFIFALISGARPEEYLGLRWTDIDFDKASATVQRVLVWQRGGGWYWDEPKTARSRRTIPLPNSLIQSLHNHRRQQMGERLKPGSGYQNNDLVFCTATGSPLHYRNLAQRNYKRILTRAGVPTTLRLYDLRHSCATLLLAENENPKVVAERLGHSNVAMTLNVYSHVLPTMQQAATEKLESILYG